jgi:hypothetical protein
MLLAPSAICILFSQKQWEAAKLHWSKVGPWVQVPPAAFEVKITFLKDSDVEDDDKTNELILFFAHVFAYV